MARIEGMTLARGNRGLLIIALLAGLIAAVLVFAALAQVNDSTTTTTSAPGGTIPTVVAARDIGPNTKIEAGMVTLANVSDDLRVEGAYDNTQLVLGQVTNYVIKKNEIITPSRVGVGVDGSDKSIKDVVQPGMRAVGLQVEEMTAVGGNLIAGDRVDVFAIFEKDGPPRQVKAKMILENIEVLGVAQLTQDAHPAGNRGEASTSGVVPEDAKVQAGAGTLTLHVTPSQALTLGLAQQEATQVYTIERAAGDNEPADAPPVDLSTLTD